MIVPVAYATTAGAVVTLFWLLYRMDRLFNHAP